MKSFCIAALVALITMPALASDYRRPPAQAWTPTAGQYETAVVKAWNYYCEDQDGNKVRGIVDSYRAPELRDPNAIYIWQYPGGAHPLTETFRENRVLVECRKALDVYDVSITGVDEVLPDRRR